MNKKLLSTSLSLACHTIFLIIAFNMILTQTSNSEPISPPILIHVHLDTRPFSPSMGNEGQSPLKKNLSIAPEMKITRMNNTIQKRQKLSNKLLMKNTPRTNKKTIVSNVNVVAMVKENAPALRSPAERDTQKTLISAQEVFKNMAVANRTDVDSSVMPITDISNQIQETPIKPSLDSVLQNAQGATPYLPFDQNGSGTDIHSFLGYELYTYQDPSDGVKYFKLSIKVEEIPGSLPPLPKEITFLVDASNSIGNELLDQFKAGINKSLEDLGDNDKFNISVFTSQIYNMHEEPLANTPDNVSQAEEFLSNFRSGSTTDLYDTILKSVSAPHSIKPAYLFLVSDGQPTQGVTDSLQLINKISEVNKGRVSIFGLGAGYSNEYLMNFLSFTNHGWAEFVPLNTVDSIVQLYDHIKDPVLMNLRYYSSGLDKNEIYPKLLPDLFKGSEFTLYGRFTNEGDFLFQLRGDSQGDIKQYIIKDNLNNGREGDRTIAEEWAMRKIYNLIGELQYNQNNQEIIDEINQLSSKFDLKIPRYKINE